jgi:hypothetical protein
MLSKTLAFLLSGFFQLYGVILVWLAFEAQFVFPHVRDLRTPTPPPVLEQFQPKTDRLFERAERARTFTEGKSPEVLQLSGVHVLRRSLSLVEMMALMVFMVNILQ